MSTDANGYAPEFGEAVEVAAATRYGLELVDGAHVDAYTTGNEPLQIKGTQVRISNGSSDRDGCITCWSEELLHLLADGGMYLLVLYDPEAFDPETDAEDVDPDDFILTAQFVTPDALGAAAADYWGDAHRPSKGQRARVPWPKLLDYVPEATDADVAEAVADGGVDQ